MKLSKYSVNNTLFKIVGKNKIIKFFEINIKELKNLKNRKMIFNEIKRYHSSLSSNGVPVPKVLNLKIQKNKFYCMMDYKGKNLLNYLNDKNFFNKINRILPILKIIKNKKILFDPHIKNFVSNKDDIFYVDIYPPYTKKYISLRKKYFLNKKEKELIQKNFKIFGPNFLAAHFFGDIVKEKPKLMNKFKSFYNLSYKLKLTSVTRKTFYRQVKMIIDTEQKREKHNFYLI